MKAGNLSVRRALRAALPLWLFCVVGWPAAAAAQQLQGRVLLRESGVAGVPVELHRVTRDTAGVVGTATTDARGSFAITLLPVDTAGFTVYFATTEYQGVRYFGTPLHPNDPRDQYAITVFDTVAVAAADVPVRVARRDLVLLPDPAGGWEVNEIVRLINPGAQTLVARQAMPTWEFRVPTTAESVEVGEGEFDAAELARMGDRILLNAPIIPGAREIFVRYRIPPRTGELRIPFDTPTDSVTVFVRQPAPALSIQGLRIGDAVEADGSEFRRYGAADLGPGAFVTIGWNASGSPIDPMVAAVVILGALLLLGAGAAAWRRPRPGAGQGPTHFALPAGALHREPAAARESAD